MAGTLLWLDPKALHADGENVRRDTGDVNGMAQTMQRFGVLQPLGVRRDGKGFTIIYGNRRREAALLAGLHEVPCLLVEESGEGDGAVRQLLENVQRQQLNDLDQARAFRRLLDDARRQQPDAGDGTLYDHVGKLVGLSQATVQRYLSLLELAPGVQAALADGSLSVTHAQHLRAVKDTRKQEEVAAYAIREHLSAAQLSRLCSVLVRQPQLTPEAAAEAAQSNMALGSLPVSTPSAPAKLPSRPSREDDGGSDDYFTPAEQATGPEAEVDLTPNGKPTGAARNTADGNRVFRIRSVASFCDEVDRLTRCLQDGDLMRVAKGDDEAPIRLSLALKQLQFAGRALEELAQQQGWVE
ncbi:MAG: ParB/RepB/Spo0J family partition protein [Chloroflexota bacterium]